MLYTYEQVVDYSRRVDFVAEESIHQEAGSKFIEDIWVEWGWPFD